MTGRRGPPEFVVVLDAASFAQPDVATVAALARAQLALRQAKGELRLLRAPEELQDLIDLLGLADVLVDDS